MLPLLGAGLGALFGGAKSIGDGKRFDEQKKVAAETTRWSPWTGMTGQMPEAPNAFGSIMQGGMSGAAMGQGMQSATNQDALNDKYLGILQGQNSGGISPNQLTQQISSFKPNFQTPFNGWK